MDFGIFMEFGNRQDGTEVMAFREGFDLVDACEAWGLDGAWLAEFHFNPVRSVLSSPIVVASAIATRTKRLRIGMAVYVLPLNNPLRIAEEVATVDHISEGRFDLGIGRSGFTRSYDIYGTPYDESQGRFRETLEVLRAAWKGEPFSYHGEYFHFENAVVSPRPYQQPHPPLRIAAVTPETFPRVAKEGFPIFVGLRGMATPELRHHLQIYRKTWKEAGHPGDGNVYLRIPVYAGNTETAALEEPRESIAFYFKRQSRLVAQNEVRRGASVVDSSEGLGTAERLASLDYDDILETKVAFGSSVSLIDRLKHLEEELGLDGIVAEMNAGGLIPAEQVKQSLKILTHQVMPAFK
jgi:alkanesulfonate monooxygenase SsuD/methylene tetrahydromethanopterin reductase-like flavin-dependent oxidoreductase (luciferase family)